MITVCIPQLSILSCLFHLLTLIKMCILFSSRFASIETSTSTLSSCELKRTSGSPLTVSTKLGLNVSWRRWPPPASQASGPMFKTSVLSHWHGTRPAFLYPTYIWPTACCVFFARPCGMIFVYFLRVLFIFLFPFPLLFSGRWSTKVLSLSSTPTYVTLIRGYVQKKMVLFSQPHAKLRDFLSISAVASWNHVTLDDGETITTFSTLICRII